MRILLISDLNIIKEKSFGIDFLQTEPLVETDDEIENTRSFSSIKTKPISTEFRYLANCREPDRDGRFFRAEFTLKDLKYRPNRAYYLVVLNAETGEESFRRRVVIELRPTEGSVFGF